MNQELLQISTVYEESFWCELHIYSVVSVVLVLVTWGLEVLVFIKLSNLSHILIVRESCNQIVSNLTAR
jgi:hypothetical protein